MSALAKALSDPWRLSVCSDGFTSIRTGERNDSPDADLIASVYDDEFAPMLLAAPQMLAAGSRLIAAFDSLRNTTNAERIITGKSDLEIREESNQAISDLRAAIAKATGK